MDDEQAKALVASNTELQRKLAELEPHISKVGTLTSKVDALEKENVELKKGMNINSQEQAILTLKTKYPDVPEETLRKLPAEVREDICKSMQETISKVKAPAKTEPTDNLSAWTRAGGIGPTDDATIAAEAAEKAKVRNEAKARGDVSGMLSARGAELVSFLRQSFTGAKS